ncbi:hypothetical protein TsFJ059_006041 [Trichoderma semiorbis]|uniref:ER membrane protein complex subunit 2 n=1 Tax=Trichoderma semiorbis TaxID=1491008 RepID=A0A9P8KKB8_9HYPO|nr:hypothetical protein TsFJ059_006041 [Trichoderma semiorbis]
MPSLLLRPHATLSHAEALQVAQQAPEFLRKNPASYSASPFFSLFSPPESSNTWTIYENLLLACLRTGDNTTAHQCLERLVVRFGASDERVTALQGLVKEAEATNDSELEKVLKEYEEILAKDNTNVPISKRRIALLRAMGKTSESIEALVQFLDFSSTDAEAWMELADLYLSQGLYAQAIYAQEEALIIAPNAWNLHARLGEVLLMAAESGNEGNPQNYLAESLKRFCRSIELSDDYLRGYYGLKRVTDKLLDANSKGKKSSESDEFTLPETSTIEKLNQAATKKLGDIVRKYDAKDPLWQGYDAAEVAAARTYLSESSQKVVR